MQIRQELRFLEEKEGKQQQQNTESLAIVSETAKLVENVAIRKAE